MIKIPKLILILSCSFLFSSFAQSILANEPGYYTITTSDDTICVDIDELVRSTAKDLTADVAYSYTDGRIGFDCIHSMKLDPDSNVLVLVPFYEQQHDEFYLKELELKVVVKLLNKGLLVSCSENGVKVCTPIDDELADAPPRSFSESGFNFPNKLFHSMDEIKAYMGMIKPYREVITIIQRSIYRKSPKSEQKLLGKSFVDGQWGDGTQEALETALQMADGFEASDKISADVIKNILFSAFINTNEKVSSAGVDPIAINERTNSPTSEQNAGETGGGTPPVTAVDNIKVEELTTEISKCSIYPKECTPQKLCEMATNIKGGNTVWSAASGSAKYVRFAEGLGINCGVVAIIDACDLDPNECNISQVCAKATAQSNGETVWNEAARSYVDVAKEYKLSCGIETGISDIRPELSYNNAKPITLFGVNFDLGKNEAEGVISQRFACKWDGRFCKANGNKLVKRRLNKLGQIESISFECDVYKGCSFSMDEVYKTLSKSNNLIDKRYSSSRCGVGDLGDTVCVDSQMLLTLNRSKFRVDTLSFD